MAESSVNLYLPVKPITENPELFGELTTVYSAIRLLASAFDDIVNEVILTAFEAINIGELVAIYNDAGTGKARKAFDPTYYCIGFAANTVAIGESVLVRIRWRYPEFAPGTLTPGTRYYLSAVTAGLITTTPGNQMIGVAKSDTTLLWKPQL